MLGGKRIKLNPVETHQPVKQDQIAIGPPSCQGCYAVAPYSTNETGRDEEKSDLGGVAPGRMKIRSTPTCHYSDAEKHDARQGEADSPAIQRDRQPGSLKQQHDQN